MQSVSKRIIKFDNSKQEKQGFDTLMLVRSPFSYKGNGRYEITKKQCTILKAAQIDYKIKQYIYS